MADCGCILMWLSVVEHSNDFQDRQDSPGASFQAHPSKLRGPANDRNVRVPSLIRDPWLISDYIEEAHVFRAWPFISPAQILNPNVWDADFRLW